MIDIFGHTWKNIRTTEHFFFFGRGDNLKFLFGNIKFAVELGQWTG